MNQHQFFPLVVKTFHGLERVLAQELLGLGVTEVEIQNRAVTCQADLLTCYRINYQAATAISVLLPVAQGTVRNEDELYDLIQTVPWYEYFEIRKTIFIKVVCYSDLFRNSHYLVLKSKDAVVDQFRNKYGRRPSVAKSNAQVKIDIFIKGMDAVVSIDTSGAALFKRGYRLRAGEAPINEVLAAGMVRLTQWTHDLPLLDPMCGSGTIPIEAVLSATGRPVQFLRTEFGFQHLINYQRSIWRQVIKEDLLMSRPDLKVYGQDISREMIHIARNNALEAGIDQIQWRTKDFFKTRPKQSSGILIINPPYDQRIALSDAVAFYRQLGDHLKWNWQGWKAFVISSHLQAVKHIGLKPMLKRTLYNGPLECRWIGFDIY